MTLLFRTLSCILLLSGTSAFASPLMSKAQFEDYSVSYQCINIKFHDDLDKREGQLISLEEKFGLNDDNFDAFDELITKYENDEALLNRIRQRVSQSCN